MSIESEVESVDSLSHSSSDNVSYEVHSIKPSARSVEGLPKATLSRSISRSFKDIIDTAREDNRQTEEEELKTRDNDNLLLLRELDLDEAIRIATRVSRKPEDEESKRSEGEKEDEGNELQKVFTRPGTHGEEEELDLPPDGGLRAWLCVVGVLLLMFSTWGSNSGYGVFLEYYLNSGKFEGATPYDFALIGGIVVFCAQSLAPFAMLSVKLIGFYETLILGVILQTVGYITASFATTTWELYLSQGVCVGIPFVFLFIPGTVVLPTYFLKKRAAAMGIATAGSGLGGVVFSLAVDKVIKISGSPWALRMVGIVTFTSCCIAIAITRPRNYQRPGKVTKLYVKEHFRVIFDFRVAKDMPVIMITCWFGLAILGYVILIFTMSAYSTSVGLTANQGSAITAIMNTGQTVGRPLMGLAADRVGRINFTLTLTCVIFIFIFAWWINAHTYGSLIALSFFMGLCIGVGNVMNPVLMADSTEPKKFPASWSFMNIICGLITLVAEVIALALRNYSMPKPYLNTQIFTGFMYFGGAVVLVIFREWKVRKLLQTRLNSIDDELDDGDQEKHDLNHLRNQKEGYEKVLNKGILCYLIRAFYPIKI